jgi:hypothetical protein
MAYSVQNFLSEVSQNGLRTSNLFEMEVTSGYSDVDDVLKPITMYGNGFSLPTRTQNFNQVQFKAFPTQIPSNFVMEQNHTITVKADANGQIRRAFLAWASKVTDPAISDGSLFAGDKRPRFDGVIRIKLLDATDGTTVTEIYKLIGVQVNTVGNLQVSNEDANVSTFDVQFISQYWEIEAGSALRGAFTNQK